MAAGDPGVGAPAWLASSSNSASMIHVCVRGKTTAFGHEKQKYPPSTSWQPPSSSGKTSCSREEREGHNLPRDATKPLRWADDAEKEDERECIRRYLSHPCLAAKILVGSRRDNVSARAIPKLLAGIEIYYYS